MAVNRETADDLPFVIDYLERHPDIFLDNPALLSNLDLPHVKGRNVRSLIEYQVYQLRNKERELQKEIETLNKKQFECEQLTEKVPEQALALMEINRVEVLYDKLFLFLRQHYQCSHFYTFFFVEERPCRDYRGLRFKHIHSKLRYLFSGLYNINKPLCDSLSVEYIDAMFGKDSNKVKSTLSIPIQTDDALGLFILASEEYNAYEHGVAINLLEHLKTVFVKQFNALTQN